MKYVLGMVLLVALLGGPVGAQGEGRGIPVFGASMSTWHPIAEREAGQPCVLLTELDRLVSRPRVVVIENEHHDVITVWTAEGTLVAGDSGDLICSVETTIPVPDAAFYQVYLDGDFIAAYAADDFPIEETWRLVLVRDAD